MFKNEYIFLLLLGDIFYQCITHEDVLDKYSPINGKACYALNMWEKALSAQAEPLVPLTLSNKCNMTHIYKSKKIYLYIKIYSLIIVQCNINYENNFRFYEYKAPFKIQ